MAKKVTGYIKLQIPAGKANPSPPVGPALGQRGLNIMDFCKAFNAATQKIGEWRLWAGSFPWSACRRWWWQGCFLLLAGAVHLPAGKASFWSCRGWQAPLLPRGDRKAKIALLRRKCDFFS